MGGCCLQEGGAGVADCGREVGALTAGGGGADGGKWGGGADCGKWGVLTVGSLGASRLPPAWRQVRGREVVWSRAWPPLPGKLRALEASSGGMAGKRQHRTR